MNKLKQARIVIAARVMVAVIILLFGWWVVAGFRTQTIGTEHLGTHIVVGLIFVLPLTIIPFWGFEVPTVFKGSLSLFAVILFGALLWASLEEYVIMQRTPEGERVHIHRWWPFENHELYYSPETGWRAND